MRKNKRNLFNDISSILADMGHQEPHKWLSDPMILEALSSDDSTYHRFMINRYWRIQLGRCAENSTQERFCLFDNDTDTAYLNMFKRYVAPFIVRNRL